MSVTSLRRGAEVVRLVYVRRAPTPDLVWSQPFGSSTPQA
jgi:hypothetical protein